MSSGVAVTVKAVPSVALVVPVRPNWLATPPFTVIPLSAPMMASVFAASV